MSKKLSTQPYKGVRDFYPEDMAIQRYMFDVWSMTAEHFGYQQYDASILEPSELYKAKGAENEEMVNEQTYTFTDRGDREVTLRPEMTPTVARMVSGKKRELTFPVRWYSIPNLFRYERTQRGRLREHWQLNCDIFGVDDASADIEIILLANEIFKNFGAENGKHYEIHVSSRRLLDALYDVLVLDDDARMKATRLADRKNKMEYSDFKDKMITAVGDASQDVLAFLNADNIDAIPDAVKGSESFKELKTIIKTSGEIGCPLVFDPTIIRGFDYYTGVVFEVIDLHEDNNRSMMGGGRYDNLTSLFDDEPLPGIGFGFGDVTLKDFLESHDLMTSDITSPVLAILPTDSKNNIDAQKLAQAFREAGVSTSVDMSSKKVGKKISNAGDQFIDYAIVLGDDEISSKKYTMKDLTDSAETTGKLEELIKKLTD